MIEVLSGIWGIGGIWPIDGLDFDLIKRINLAVIVSSMILLATREVLVRRTRSRRFYYLGLGALALFSVVNYANYFSFHGERTFLHLHDLAHYYLGAKYNAELGYKHLYTAMLRAEAELYDDHFVALEVRDLSTNELVDIRQLLGRSDLVRDRFDPLRWGEFKKDVGLFHDELGPHWAGVLKDHGYNPTPVWTLIGSLISNRVPAGNRLGITLLALLDPIILLIVLFTVARTFGSETAAWALVYFCVVFGSTFGWTGGAYLRQLWFFGLVMGFCALRVRRYGFGGGLLAMAAVLRIFPLFFVVPLAIKTLAGLIERRKIPTGHDRLWIGYTSVLAIAFASTLALPDGLDTWTAFRDRIETQLDTISPNVVGLTEILTYEPEAGLVTVEEFEHLREQRQVVHRVQLFTVVPLVFLMVVMISVRMSDTDSLVLGVPLILVALNLAGYYFSFLVLLAIVHRRYPGRLAALFAAEAIPYLLLLMGRREAELYVAWSLALLVLMAVLYWRPMSRAVGRLDDWAKWKFAVPGD